MSAGEIEYELGVPFPGRVLPGDRWTKTGWKDDGLPFDWERRFGRAAPRVVDLGCGNGRSVIASALARPEHDHLGIDVVQRVIDYAAHRANKRGVTNARFVVGEAVTWIFERLAEGSIDEVDIYHPQPYYNPAELGKRILTAEFLERLWRLLRPGGRLLLQTDNKAYWKYLLQAVAKHFEPEILKGAWPDAPEGRTRREIISRRKGLVIWRMIARRRESPVDVVVPRHDFDANRPRFRKGGRRA